MYTKILIFCLLSLMSASLWAADIIAGKAKSVSCIGCHGVAGVSTIDNYPNLAGQKAKYLVKQLKDFRRGSRRDKLMSPMAKMLKDQDIENIAAYFASLGTRRSD